MLVKRAATLDAGVEYGWIQAHMVRASVAICGTARGHLRAEVSPANKQSSFVLQSLPASGVTSAPRRTG